MWHSLSSGESLPRPQPWPLPRPKLVWHWVVALISKSSPEISWMCALFLERWKPRVGPAKVRQFLSNSLAFSTNPAKVVGIGDSCRILLWSAVLRAKRNAYILVASSILALLAYLLHCWYHSLNSRFFCGVLCTLFIASICISGGMNWALKASLKACHIP